MQNQSIQRKNSKAKRGDNSGIPVDAGYLIRLPEIRFNSELVPRHRLAEIAKIFYSASYEREKRPNENRGPEPLSSILPRVMAEIAQLKQQKTN